MEQKNYCLKTSTYLKSIAFYLIGIVLVGCSSETKSDSNTTQSKPEKLTNSNLDSFGALFTNALATNDFSLISDFTPTKNDIEDIVMKFDGDDEKKKQILASSEENAKKIQENTKKGFDKILEKGNDAGLNWEEVEFIKSEYNLAPKNGVDYAELTIHFKYKELKYKLFISECIKTERGWLIFDQPEWKG